MSYYVLVAGSGKTSRANVEALMDDHYLAHGEKGVLVLPIKDRPSEGQVWAAQFATDSKKEVLVIAAPGAKFDGIPHASMAESPNPVEYAVSDVIKGETSSAFLLWEDEDEDCANALAICKQFAIPAYDLTNGLATIQAAPGLAVTTPPPVPIQETIPEPSKAPSEPFDEASEEEDELEEEEYDEEEELEVSFLAVIETIAQIFARAVVDEIEERKNK